MALLTPLLLATAERTLNQLLARDPASTSRLNALAGRRLLVRVERPAFDLLVHFDLQGLHLLRLPQANESDGDVVVELDMETAAALLSGESIERLMFEGRLAVRGRIHLLESARDLVMDLDLDWEGALSEWFGEAPGHSLANGLRSLGRFGLISRRELELDLREYLTEEARWLPGQAQMRVARDELTELTQCLDRTEARLARLRRHLEAATSHQPAERECQPS
ncbi:MULTISPECIES: SCP2 sterol-binding domain-containing protein [Cobetia]|uniref:ubiquinone biosynthesis accessory factor UbiJ n=1 Tax=Cobetia TaxID=204286 RepID=UPI0015835F7A|nr:MULTISPECIES: SCP2 sterol-binding domain-containing protein [Cobetia]MDI4661818.1 SCP2 sterol-binding domain-containing protein [Cobetia sp. BMC6]MDL2191586.1 SCP2 sterol-binding domain-containing protein [Cobetia sp. LC6]NUJ56536.1 SCP2 sterol-binding domain-containing protein [Cobetia marina]